MLNRRQMVAVKQESWGNLVAIFVSLFERRKLMNESIPENAFAQDYFWR